MHFSDVTFPIFTMYIGNENTKITKDNEKRMKVYPTLAFQTHVRTILTIIFDII